MKRCTLIIPDAGPFNSLWVADQLSLLLTLDMRLVVVDAVYDELTSDDPAAIGSSWVPPVSNRR